MSKTTITMFVFLLAIFSSGLIHAGEWEDLLKEVKKDLRRDSVADQVEGIEKLEGQDHIDALDYLFLVMKNRRTPFAVANKAAEVVSTYKSNEVKERMFKYVKRNPYSNLFIFKAFAEMGVEENKPVLIKVIENDSKYKLTKAYAIKGLAKYDNLDNKTIDLLIEQLKEGNFHSTRRAAAETLGSITDKKVPPALIKYLNDRLAGEMCKDSLERLTGENFGYSPKKWEEWWAKNKETVTLKKVTLKEYIEAKKAAEKNIDQDNEAMGSEASFYGINVKGKNILFVLDKSGSMGEGSGSAMEKLKEELSNMIDKLPEDVSIGLVFFGARLSSYPTNKVKELSERNKKSFKKFIGRVRSKGGTPIGDAMELSFDKIIMKNNIDTVYLLSDGMPTKPPEEVRKRIKELNAYHGVYINTISVGRPSPFLSAVAEDNNGKYHEIR